ncbi:sporulation peptidase YabG [Candidatus Epulonipiscium viviparus]|uniref:sporulation peptidase YabG n=1 Tax=Candidatus Epulonipiscium viviparus TaxID=420336 RepID=UPI00016C0704|nr:sporulation peptidase YabG [Candidatus Epulopiscium viviparus]
MLTVGDYVLRQSYSKDILFKIDYITRQHVAVLKGVTYRILADADIRDLVPASGLRSIPNERDTMDLIDANVSKVQEEHKQLDTTRMRKIGKVLHIDGDAFYLNVCLNYYETLGITAVGENVAETVQPRKVKELIEKHNPDILVLTGHDSLQKGGKTNELENYKNSKYYIESTKEARKIRPTSDQLVIFAGACQSYFEELLLAGADFAASPNRVLIHALDPVFIVERIAYCPFYKVLDVTEAIKYTITQGGVGGYEVLGKSRDGGPIFT